MLIGRRLSGRYKVLGVIGGGGMANVYLARDVILERDVAIKVLRLDFSNNDEFIKRFRREAHSATSLAHPNIVNIYDIGEEENIYYIVMEYVSGTTLKQYIQQFAPLHPEEALAIMRQLTSAISHAHQNHIVHRDIKPQNILIDHDGTVKVTDFGIAIALSSTTITQTNSILGTVHYLSPEQARGGMATRKSDIYSLGIVLFELLTGRVPFQGESAVSIALKHLQHETPSPKRWNAAIPQSVENIILKATAKDPFHRYATVEEMEEDMETALYPNRINEARFLIPIDEEEVTKAIPIIKDLPDEVKKQDNTIISDPVEKSVNMQTGENGSKKPRKKGKKIIITLVSLFLLLLAAGVASVTIIPSIFLPDDISVPDVSEMQYDDAVKILVDKGFYIEDPIKQAHETIPEGYVIRTTPEANAVVKEGSTISIIESTGKKKVEFEDFINQNIEDVKEELENKGFTVRTEKVFHESQIGTIIGQSILEGELVIPDETEVVFEISQGPQKFVLRDLKDYNKKSLNDYAELYEIEIEYGEEQFSEDVEKGLVITQNPAAGTELEKKAKVTVVFSKGPEPKPDKEVKQTITIPYDPIVHGEEQNVKIMVQDANNSISDIYEEFKIKETTRKEIIVIVPYGEVARWMLFIDDRLIDQAEIPYPENGQ